MLIPVILSGGSGTRLWPLSTADRPKQFLPLAGPHSLFQETLRRLDGIPGLADPVVVCNESHRALVAGQLRDIGAKAAAILLEPAGRNTAPAIGAAASIALEHLSEPKSRPGLDPTLLVLPSDHVIGDAAAFRTAVAAAVAAARRGRLVTFGIVPTAPETGYGYIELGAEEGGVRNVARFVEKPDLAKANEYLASGRFLWNSGMFVFTAATLLAELARVSPATATACRAAAASSRRDGDIVRLGMEFLECPADSIDYAVMEKTDKASVVPLAAGWSDVGSWGALHAALAQDQDGNVLRGNVTAVQARDNLVFAGSRKIALLGVDDLVVVDAGDAVLVAHRSRSQAVKDLLRKLESEPGKK